MYNYVCMWICVWFVCAYDFCACKKNTGKVNVDVPLYKIMLKIQKAYKMS